jgi:hypothetical protein
MLKWKQIASEQRKVDPRMQGRPRACNLCGETFKTPTARCCICDDCKLHHELYRSRDWLPDELAVA